MPSKVEKFRRKLDSGRRTALDEVLIRLDTGDFFGLALKKLRGSGNRYRVRVGDMRVQFSLSEDRRAVDIEVEFRNDTTYH